MVLGNVPFFPTRKVVGDQEYVQLPAPEFSGNCTPACTEPVLQSVDETGVRLKVHVCALTEKLVLYLQAPSKALTI